jgi:hypothetical protein
MKVIPPQAWPRNAIASGERKPWEPATIGDMVRSGQGMTATCEVCLHSGRLDLAKLSQLFGENHACSKEDLCDRLQCSVCGSREAIVREVAPTDGRDDVPAAKIAVVAEV